MTDSNRLLASWSLVQTGVSDAETVGHKAAGLLSLPQSWYPPFVVLTPKFCEEWRLTQRADLCLLRLSRGEQAALKQLFGFDGFAHRSGRVLIRSNDRNETGACRGKFHSEVAQCDMRSLACAIDAVLCADPRPDSLIVQPLIAPNLPGHMSNERRVSEDRRSWLCEYEDGGELKQTKLRALHSGHQRLDAADFAGVTDALRNVADSLESIPTIRHHVEWLWDARRLWVVQVDSFTRRSNPEVSAYLRSEEQRPELDALTYVIHQANQTDEDTWLKLRRHGVFRELALPVPLTYVLTVAQFVALEAAGEIANLLSDLAALMVTPLVVRVTGKEELDLLPTSNPILSPQEVVQYLRTTTPILLARGKEMAYLLAPLVAVRASAMVQAFPGSPQVKIDAIWGFPDGLLHFPHDTHLVRPDRTHVDKRYKSLGVFVDATEGWKVGSIPAPFDWEQTLDGEESRVAARWGRAIAEHEGTECQLMVLARIGGLRGERGMLPWYYTRHQSTGIASRLDYLPITKRITVVRDYGDLRALSGVATDMLRLKPDATLLRDAEFLQETGKVAATLGLVIYFEGSLLGHAYYLLSSTGASVVPVVSAEPTELREDHKLVRDLIPAIIQSAGATAVLRNVTPEQALILLKQKMVEEAFEVWGATDDTLMEELADVSEVARALAAHIGESADEIERVRIEKVRNRGGFDQLLYLDHTAFSYSPPRVASDTLPLTLDTHEHTARSERRRPLRVATRADGSVELSVPLVPPVVDGRGLEQMRSATGPWDITVEYRGSSVVILVAPRAEEVRHQDPNTQAPLPFDLAD